MVGWKYGGSAILEYAPLLYVGNNDRLGRRNPFDVVDSFPFEVFVDLAVVFADMLRVPTIAASSIACDGIVWKCRRSAFECDVARTHDSLSDIVETMIYMEGHFDEGWIAFSVEDIVRVKDGVQTVELVGH